MSADKGLFRLKKTFKYKAKISKETEKNCFTWLYLCRTLYNLCLEQRIICWKQWKKSITCYEQKNELPVLKSEFPEFKKVGAQVLQDVVERLDRAYQNFFRRIKAGDQPGFPRFKSRDRYNSFTLKQNSWKLEGQNLYIKGLGRFKLFLSRPIEGKIKTITIRITPTKQWFVCFSCDEVPPKVLPKAQKSDVGIDVGISSFLTDSEGNKVESPKFFRKGERELRRRQRSLSRKKRGSNRRKEAKRQVAKIHEKVFNKRNDFTYKLALAYLIVYQTIYIEKLNIKGMVKNRHLSKSISDVAWGMFFAILQVKAEEAGREVIEVNPCNTSQNCSKCSKKVPKDLSVRIHKCPYCGLIIDRDENAAINILQRGRAVREGHNLTVKVSLESIKFSRENVNDRETEAIIWESVGRAD